MDENNENVILFSTSFHGKMRELGLCTYKKNKSDEATEFFRRFYNSIYAVVVFGEQTSRHILCEGGF